MFLCPSINGKQLYQVSSMYRMKQFYLCRPMGWMLECSLKDERITGTDWLMVPVPFNLAFSLYLQIATAWAVEPIVRSLGIPVVRDNTILTLPSNAFVVSDACSGFSTLYAAVGIAAFLAYASRSKLRAGILVAFE